MPIDQRQPQGLVDILDKILDKGLVVAGDIKVSLANVELLTIQLRLVICSIDKAEAIGINWWRSDRFYSAAANAGTVSAEEYDALKARMNSGTFAAMTSRACSTSSGARMLSDGA